MQFPEEKFIIYYTIICNNVINLLYGLPYVKPISHIALCCQIFVLYFVHSFCFFFFLFFSFLWHFYVWKRMNFCSCPYGNPSSQKLFRGKRKYSSTFRELCYKGEGKLREKREERQIGRNLWEKKRPNRVTMRVWEEREKVKEREEMREL